ncbi:MAG: Addiction module antitoxin [Phycisphaerales bacterium]|jgi:plasmid stability protein|nr:Addiction module antitoxin [Phycisphaerales bacterium]
MARLTLDLPDDLRSKLQVRADETGHGSIEEHIAALIRADVGQSNLANEDHGAPEHLTIRSRENLEAKLVEGLQSPAAEMTPADWDDMRRRFLDRHSGSGSR